MSTQPKNTKLQKKKTTKEECTISTSKRDKLSRKSKNSKNTEPKLAKKTSTKATTSAKEDPTAKERTKISPSKTSTNYTSRLSIP